MYIAISACPYVVEQFSATDRFSSAFLLNGKKPSRAAWFLKEKLLPPIYWQAMLRGKEWMAKPEVIGES